MNVKGYEIPQDVPLLLGLLVQLISMEVRIRRQPLPDIIEKLLGTQKSPRTLDGAESGVMMDKIWRGCGFWQRRLFRTERLCLRRSLVLFRWRLRQGLPVRLLIGVDRNGDDLMGHAWIETPTGPCREDVKRLPDYVVMLKYEG